MSKNCAKIEHIFSGPFRGVAHYGMLIALALVATEARWAKNAARGDLPYGTTGY